MKKMKKPVNAILLLLAFTLTATIMGCGKKYSDVARSTVYVEKNGSVVSVDIEDFSMDYYSEDELDSYIKEMVDTYTSTYGESIELKDISVEDDKAKVVINYDSLDDYARLNNVSLFQGTVSDAKTSGYSFTDDFYSVSGAEPEIAEYTPDGNDLCIITKAGSDVMVDGNIKYVSALADASLYVSGDKDACGYDGENLLEKTMIVIYTR